MSKAAITIVLLFATCACSTDSSSTSPTVPSGATGDSLLVSGTAGVATSIPASDPASDPVVASVDDSVEPATPRSETPLETASYRTDEVVGPMVPILFDLPVDGLYVTAEEGFLGINAEPGGDATLVAVTQVDNGEVFLRPTVDFAQLPNEAYRADLIGPVPDDVLTWLAGRPGVTAGEILETTAGGWPARSMTYAIGSFDGGSPCLPAETRACHATFWAAVTGLAQLYLVGDSGTMYEVHAANQRFVVDVYDVEYADEIFSSLRFLVEPPPSAPPTGEPVPFVGPHAAGVPYYSERSSNGLYLFEGVDEIGSTVSRLRDPALVLESEGVECLSIVDGSRTQWLTDAEAGVTTMPDDLIAAVRDLTELEVVDGPFSVPLGEVEARGIDVRARTAGVQLANFSTPLPTEVVSHIIEVPRFDGAGADLIVVIADTMCEQLLATLELVPNDR